MNFPENLKYTKEHEWVRLEGDVAIVGITEHAQAELGDIVYVEVETVGETLPKEEVFGAVEAIKTTADLFMPIGGEVLELNPILEDNPEKINEDPYGEGWIIKIKVSEESELDDLLDVEEYKAEVDG